MKKKWWTGYLFVMPGLIGSVIFVLIPYLDVMRRAFFQVATGTFVGMTNFTKVFRNKAFRLAVTNTVHFVGVCIPILLILSLLISVSLMENTRFSKMMKTGFMVPMAIPVASVVLLWRFLFGRQMNTSYAFYVLVFSYVWKNLGYSIVLWVAGLSMITGDIYEAAKVDGAGKMQMFFLITLPNLTGTFFTITVLSLINSFKVFREAYLVSGDYPDGSIYMLQHLFNNWFRNLDMDKMAAGAVINSVVIFLLIWLLWKLGGKQE